MGGLVWVSSRSLTFTKISSYPNVFDLVYWWFNGGLLVVYWWFNGGLMVVLIHDFNTWSMDVHGPFRTAPWRPGRRVEVCTS